MRYSFSSEHGGRKTSCFPTYPIFAFAKIVTSTHIYMLQRFYLEHGAAEISCFTRFPIFAFAKIAPSTHIRVL